MNREEWLKDRFHVVTASAEETASVGAQFGKVCQPGDLVALRGPLGGGKTCFVQGVASGRGIHVSVKSPTFTLIHRYQGANQEMWHVDCYRLSETTDPQELGLDELMEAGGLMLVEWAERIDGWISRYPHFDISFRIRSVNEREITITHVR